MAISTINQGFHSIISMVACKYSSSMPFRDFSFGRVDWASCRPSLCSAMFPRSCTAFVTICKFLWFSNSTISSKYYCPCSMIWFLASFTCAREHRQIVVASITWTDELVIKGEILITPFLQMIELFPSSLKEIAARLLMASYFTTSES